MNRNLLGEVNNFLSWLGQKSMPGFSEFTADAYHGDDYKTIYEELEYLGGEIKRAAHNYDVESFDLFKGEYEKLFASSNISLATNEYNNIRTELIEAGFSDLDADKGALNKCWNNPTIAYWLPLSALLKDGKGGEIHLVQRKEHTPQGKHYVTVSELDYLKSSGRDPWQYCYQRGAA